MAGLQLTVAGALARVEAAIEYGELVAQRAPMGHAIFAAVTNAQDLAEQLRGSVLFGEGPVIPVGGATYQRISQAITQIYDASGSLRTDPETATRDAIWPKLPQLPWGWIAAGAGALVALVVLTKPRRSR